jgi:tetratricopeptide (TPR) repeat protein
MAKRDMSRRDFLKGLRDGAKLGVAAWAASQLGPLMPRAEAREPTQKTLKQMVEEDIKRIEAQRKKTPFEWTYLADLYCERHRWQPDEKKRREYKIPDYPYAFAVCGRIEILKGNFIEGKNKAVFNNLNDAIKHIGQDIRSIKRRRRSLSEKDCEKELVQGYANFHLGTIQIKHADIEDNQEKKAEHVKRAIDFFKQACDNVEANSALINVYTDQYIKYRTENNSRETRKLEREIKKIFSYSGKLLKKDNKYRFKRFALAKAKSELALNYEMGRFYNIAEDFKNAQKCLDIAFKLDPDTADISAELALAYEGLGNQNKKKNNLPAARAHYTEAKTSYETAKKTLEASGFKNDLLAKKLGKKIAEMEAKTKE